MLTSGKLFRSAGLIGVAMTGLVIAAAFGSSSGSNRTDRRAGGVQTYRPSSDLSHPLGQIPSLEQGPRYDQASHAAAASHATVPDCPGASSFTVPAQGHIVGWFDEPDLIIEVQVAEPYTLERIGNVGADRHVRYDRSGTINGYDAVGFEWDGQLTRIVHPDGTEETQGGGYRSGLWWNVDDAGIHFISSSKRSLAELTSLAEKCSYARPS